MTTTSVMNPNQPLELFFSYAHEDEELRDELEKHLKLLKRQGYLATWYDREIGAGSEWKGQIDAHLEGAQIILLLISADFIASDYCYDVEMGRALQRHEAGEARVIPVVLREVDLWPEVPFAKLQMLPRDGQAVTTWPDHDVAFKDVAAGIRQVVEKLRQGSPVNKSENYEEQGLHALITEAIDILQRVHALISNDPLLWDDLCAFAVHELLRVSSLVHQATTSQNLHRLAGQHQVVLQHVQSECGRVSASLAQAQSAGTASTEQIVRVRQQVLTSLSNLIGRLDTTRTALETVR